MYIFPTDGSEQARQAENAIESLLDPTRDSVLVLTVIEEQPNPFANAERKADYETEMIENAEQVAGSVAHRLQEKGFETETEVLHGEAGTTICQHAEERDADGIIMGRRGLGAAGELLLGSVSQYVLHHADCPVTIVPPADQS